MDKPIDSLAQEFRPTLAPHGFKEVERWEPGIVSDGLITYRKDSLRIRLVVDRGVPSVDIARADSPDDWVDLQMVKNYLASQPAKVVSAPSEIADIYVVRDISGYLWSPGARRCKWAS
jgi:hypothetical protein